MQAHFRPAMMLLLALVALSSRAASPTDPLCTTVEELIDFRPWADESYPAVDGFLPGQWVVSTDGSSTFQINNGQPTLFVSDFKTGRLKIVGRMRVEPGWDDDFIGFTLGYNAGDNTNVAADYLLVDWKRGSQYFDFAWPSQTPGSTAWAGLAVSRVHGVPTADELWGHVDFDHPTSPLGQGAKELARARTLGGTGWEYSRDYEFTFEFGEAGLVVFVDGTRELEVPGDFAGLVNGRFAFYNFSQESVRYSGFTRHTICPPVAYGQSVATTESTPVSITLAADDPDGHPLTYVIVTPPAFGTLSGTGANVVYTPNPGFVGSDSFTFKVNDATTSSNTATVSIQVTPIPICSGASGRWLPTGRQAYLHLQHTTTLLETGKVLVTGGYWGPSELYDLGSGVWATTGSTYVNHRDHTSTLLLDGRVLVAGGDSGESGSFSELYDPSTATWTPTGGMTAARAYHTATLLSDGKVLVVGGGKDNDTLLSSAELYDPVTGTWTPTGSMTTARGHHTATLLPNGKVLVVGGSKNSYTLLSSAELYDPVTGTWTPTGSMTAARSYHTATLLPNGKVLVVGGGNSLESSSTVELYDPGAGTWTATGNMMAARRNHTATLLPDGRVLVVGGYNEFNGILNSAEVFNVSSGTWCSAGNMAEYRYGHTATLLPNGQVLVTAGVSTTGYDQYSAELYEP